MATQDLIELEITRLGDQGDGVARLDGALVHAPWTLPGDRVRARRLNKQMAAPVEWLARAPDHAEPACPHFGRCGGCALQHLQPDLYCALKRDRVVNALKRARLHDAVIGALIVIPPGTRRRATFAACRQSDAVRIGFNERMSHDVVDVMACAILRPELMRLMSDLRQLVQPLARGGALDLSATLTATGIDLLIAGLGEPGSAARAIITQFAQLHDLARVSVRHKQIDLIAMHRMPVLHFGGVAVEPPPGAFLQASEEGEAAIVAAVRAGVGKARRIADLFAGCGALTFPLAADAQVHAVDGAEDQIAAIDTALRRASLSGRVTAERRDLERRPLLPGELKRFDAVVFDPPFAGAASQAAQLARSQVKRIVGVSCNPATFARDAATLSGGGYRLTQVTPIDQFLWSPHVEVVGVFEKR